MIHTLPEKLHVGDTAKCRREGRLAVYDDRGECFTESRYIELERGEEFLAALVIRWNAYKELEAFVEQTLDYCFCDDGRGLPECARCLTARALLEKVKP